MAIQEAAPPGLTRRPPGTALLYDPIVRAVVSQIVVVAAILVAVIWIVDNTIENLRRANIASGFGFLSNRAGFDISQTLISYSTESSYGRALLVGVHDATTWTGTATKAPPSCPGNGGGASVDRVMGNLRCNSVSTAPCPTRPTPARL